MKNKRMNVLVLAMATMSVSPVWAQTSSDSGTMDHSQHQGGMAPAGTKAKVLKDAMPAMDHSKMPGMTASPPAEGMSMPAADSMPAMDHSKMDHGSMNQSAQPVMQPVKSGTADGMAGMDHGNQPAVQSAKPGMDHGEMNMQGGSAPADARDPHANSGGFTLDSGAYALPPSQRLHLADEHNFGSLLIDSLEKSYTRNNGNSTSYDTQAWFGRTYNRLVIKAEGEVAKGKLQEARTELLWGHAIATFWDTQLGVRYDSGVGPDRGWLAFGVQGLAPYWFEVDATAYAGENGRTALRLGAEYELLLTQKLILQPRIELNLYGKSDVERGIGSGLSEAQTGLRLRYEFTRQFAPYIGVERVSKFGQTADLARDEGEKSAVTRWVAGVRFWF